MPRSPRHARAPCPPLSLHLHTRHAALPCPAGRRPAAGPAGAGAGGAERRGRPAHLPPGPHPGAPGRGGRGPGAPPAGTHTHARPALQRPAAPVGGMTARLPLVRARGPIDKCLRGGQRAGLLATAGGAAGGPCQGDPPSTARCPAQRADVIVHPACRSWRRWSPPRTSSLAAAATATRRAASAPRDDSRPAAQLPCMRHSWTALLCTLD